MRCTELEPRPPLRIPRLPRQLLIKLACEHHNRLQRQKSAQLVDLYAEIQEIQPTAHPRVLERLCVNYLHAQAEKYCPELAIWRGDPRHYSAYASLKGHLLDRIAAYYDWLSAECQHQRPI